MARKYTALSLVAVNSLTLEARIRVFDDTNAPLGTRDVDGQFLIADSNAQAKVKLDAVALSTFNAMTSDLAAETSRIAKLATYIGQTFTF